MISVERAGRESLVLNIDSFENNSFLDLDFHRAVLSGVNMSHSKIINCTLRNAELNNALCVGTHFSQSSLIMIDAQFANFENAVMKDIQIIGAKFEEAILKGANFNGSDIGHACFKKAVLLDAELLCNRIDQASFEGAVYNSATKWPEGFNPLEYGAIEIQNLDTHSAESPNT